jgi:hypothetical protein
MDSLIPVVMIFAGVVIGSVVTTLVLRAKAKRSFEDGKADSVTQVTALQERLSARDQELQKLQQSLEKEIGQRERLREDHTDLKAQLEGERRAAQERSESFKLAAEELSQKFKALSRDALRDNNQSFLDLARATLEKFQTSAKGDLELRQNAIDQLVKPLKESLERVDGKMARWKRRGPGPILNCANKCGPWRHPNCSFRLKRETWSRLCELLTFAAVGERFSCGASSNSPGCFSTATLPSRRRSQVKMGGYVPI